MSNKNSDEVGYTNHTGFGGILGQKAPANRQGFANAATPVVAATAAEAIAAAGLDWTVSKRPAWFTGKGNGSKPVKIPNAFAIVKDDTEQYLGTVGKQYHAIQNIEAFDWADLVTGEYVAGGAMRSDRNVYLIKKLGETIIAGGDATELFLLLRSSHDGTKALSGMVTPIRPSCMNMIPLATKHAVSKFAVRHVTSYADKLAQAAQVAGLVDAYAFQFKIMVDQLAATPVSTERAEQVLTHAMPGRTELISGIMANLATSTTISDEQRLTAWGVVNATTEYIEWGRTTTSNSHALQANLDGQGARIRNAVTAQLMAGV